jgi:hypothetical protein
MGQPNPKLGSLSVKGLWPHTKPLGLLCSLNAFLFRLRFKLLCIEIIILFLIHELRNIFLIVEFILFKYKLLDP